MSEGVGLSAAGRVEVFEYPAGADAPDSPDWSGFTEAAAQAGNAPRASGKEEEQADRQGGPDWNKHIQEEKRRAFDEGRQRGVQEGRQAERESQAAVLAGANKDRVHQAARLVESFAVERDRFLHTVEREVVKLALAVAARILRREAQMDPLLLTGAVRVALGQLAGSTEVRLKVPAAELDLWTEAVALLPNLALKPIVLAGEGMRLGDCAIDALMGTVDLGIRSQLAVIERGFFDRTGVARPKSAPRLDETGRPEEARDPQEALVSAGTKRP